MRLPPVILAADGHPNSMLGEESEIEIRPIIEAEEFGEEFARGKAERMRAVQSRTR